MVRIVIALVVLLFVSVPASAQTVILEVELTQFGAWKAKQVEDDGDPRTPRAWLLWINPKWNDPGERYQLIVPKANGTLCAEAPFIPTDTFAHVELGAMDGRDVLMVFTPGIFQAATMEVIALNRKYCR